MEETGPLGLQILLKQCNKQGQQYVKRESPVLAGGLLFVISDPGSPASSHPEASPGTPWLLQCCHTLRRQQGTSRLWAVHETLLQETQNPSRRLTSCRPYQELLVFSLQSVDKHNYTILLDYIVTKQKLRSKKAAANTFTTIISYLEQSYIHSCNCNSYLIFGCIVALWEIPIDLSVMKQVVVDQVPAPALVITAQQSHITLALHGRPLRGNAYHCYGAKGAFPPDLPGMSPLRKANFATCSICALGNGVTVKGETILFHVNIAGTVVRAQSMLKSLQL